MSKLLKRFTKNKKAVQNGEVNACNSAVTEPRDKQIPVAMSDHQDLYRLPPMEVQPFDEWKEEETNAEKAAYRHYQSTPELGGFCGVDYELTDYQGSKNKLENKFKRLSHEEYADLVVSVESDLADIPIPEPDYVEDEETQSNGAGHITVIKSRPNQSPTQKVEGLIEPKKLRNPCLESREKQDLHREMLLNQRLGVDVLHQKTELQKKMIDRRVSQKKKEQEELEKSRRTSLERKLEEQASKLRFTEEAEELAKNRPEVIPENQSEFLKVHSKISRSKSDR